MFWNTFNFGESNKIAKKNRAKLNDDDDKEEEEENNLKLSQKQKKNLAKIFI